MQPATAGGFSDTLSRLIAQGLSTHLGQTVFIENRPGAMNMLANKLVSRSDPDGYTLLWGPIDMTMAPALRKDAAGFSGTKDLTPIAMVASSAGVYVVNPKVPVNTLKRIGSLRQSQTWNRSQCHQWLRWVASPDQQAFRVEDRRRIFAYPVPGNV